MPNAITIRQDHLLLSLAQLDAAIGDTPDLLRIAGSYMLGSVARTFRDEGSPAGSWPELAESTKKKKGYTAGHKLLILSGRLFGSITYAVDGNAVRIGTGVAYAAVHQFGSIDRQGSQAGGGPKRDADYVNVKAHQRGRTIQKQSKAKGLNRIRIFRNVSEHQRHQNIPARPYLVFRPEDPANITSALQAYIVKKSPAVKQ